VGLKEIGWNGFLIRVPEEMHFTRQGGNAKEGTFVIESEEGIIDLSWRPIQEEPQSLLSAVETIIDYAKKEAKKKGLKFSIKEKQRVLVNKHDAFYLLVKSAVEERYYIWLCKESGRIASVRFIFKEFDEKAKRIIKQFLSSLRCHTDGNNVWSLLKIRFEAPKSLLLTESRFGVGRAHITLAEKEVSALEERTRSIHVDYFSVANLIFKDTYQDPGRWFEKNYKKEFRKMLKKWRIKFDTIGERELGGHKAVIKEARTTSGLLTRGSEICSVACWYCEDMNRMYSVAVRSRIVRFVFLKRRLKEEEHNEMFDSLLRSFKCH